MLRRATFGLLLCVLICVLSRGCGGRTIFGSRLPMGPFPHEASVPWSGAVPKVGMPPSPAASHGLAVLDWIVGVSFLGAAACFVLSILAVSVFGAGLGFTRKLAAALLGVGLGSLIFKVVVVKYLWLLVLLSVLTGIVSALAFAYGHRKALEKFFNIDLDQDGHIGRGVDQ